MNVYNSLKRLLITHVLNFKKRFMEFNLKMNTRKAIKETNRKNNTAQLKPEEVQQAKAYFKSKGYNLQNTYWHSYYKSISGEFYPNYIPEDIFSAIISPKFNEMRQWPALLDKNLSYALFKEVNQPVKVVQNINGFYYVDNEIVSEAIAVKVCNKHNKPFVIKPTIDSGNGIMVESFRIKNNRTTYKNLETIELFRLYKKDFIVQELVEQSSAMKELNPSSLNTLRLMSYLKPDGVHILSSVIRIGQPGHHTDNFSGGGIVCGIDPKGNLKHKGYSKNGNVYTETHTHVSFKGFQIPNYSKVLDMVKTMHPKVPYFKFISWDIGINDNEFPVFIEYNTYYQDVDLHQITNGPLFGEFTDEILSLGLK